MVFNSQAFKAPQLGRKRVSMKKTLGDVAQSGVNPATGEYLSSGERKALFKKRTVSAEKVFGKPGALVKINNLESIVKTSKDEEKKGESSTDTESLGTRVSSLEKSIVTIQESIKKLSEFLVDDAKKEQQLLLKGQKTEDITKEKEKRKRKEFGLESVAKGIGNTLLAPIKAIGGKVKGILSRVLEFLKILFIGWLTDKGIKAFRSYMDGNKEEFEKIRNNILGALGIVGGIIAGVSGGLAVIPGLVLGIIPIIAKIGAAIVGFLLSPAGLIALAVAAGAFAVNKIDTIVRGGAAGAEYDDKAKKEAAESGIMIGSGGTGVSLLNKDGTLREVNAYDLPEGDPQKLPGPSLTGRKAIPGKENRNARIKLNLKNPAHREYIKKVDGLEAFKRYDAAEKFYRTRIAEKDKVRASKKEELEKIKENKNLTKEEREEKRNKVNLKYKTDLDQLFKRLTPVDSTPTPTPTPPSTPIPTPTPPVTSLAQTRTVPTAEPKKKPTVIFRPNPQVQQKEPASVTNGNSETPNISSSNPNNFYTMYSQIQYNVVR